ncbi:type VII secretion-associated protein [Mycobacterium sp. 4D054]|uniref:type VII secretion-associated protein n=1 Tax=unclassified Mycobacterium TaxID=2642494 RepID=UPI0021B25EAB|nr:type VII secretion-associated protein [Mycobacterium sp. SMC-8]UXA14748.1 type VII secretion-associated protein [Mycobacterium sp. SMC-8]
MTTVVVEVGPAAVRGPDDAPREWVSAALACIDDPLALVQDRVVDVAVLWRDVLRAAAGGAASHLVLVVPTWWPAGRAGVVGEAARGLAPQVTVLRRGSVLGDGGRAVVELAAEVAVVTRPGAGPAVVSRDDDALIAHLHPGTSVLIDTPAAVAPLSPTAAARLGRLAAVLTYGDRIGLHAAVRNAVAQPRRRKPPNRRSGAVLAGVALTAAAAGGGWAAQAVSDAPPSPAGSRLLREGRVGVSVPASWTVERVTAGPGSPRVRVAAAGGLPALHLTQADGDAASVEEVAESLRRAMGSAPPGVFVDFDPDGERAGRAAVTYLERRTDSQTWWTVLVDGTLRIAIGCQSAPEQRRLVEDVCDEAVRSAHALR